MLKINFQGERCLMEVIFSDKGLLALYQTGFSKKYPLPQNIIKKFFVVIRSLESANDIYDLWKTTSLNFEKMQGFENRFSSRLNKGWRLEMEISWTNEEKTVGIISLETISKHYQ